MDIVKLKAEIAQYDQQEKRMPVYACLKEAWASEPPSEQLTVLVIAQMLNYLEWIDGAYKIVVEAPDEFSLYWDFETEAATYGFEHYRQGKMFLWEMCRVLVCGRHILSNASTFREMEKSCLNSLWRKERHCIPPVHFLTA